MDYGSGFPPPGAPSGGTRCEPCLDDLDMQILEQLHRKPFASVPSLDEELRISYNMLFRQVTTLLRLK
jgi:hypothetical protein